MSSTETTELKLQSTPTGGVDASHSPYYRRLLSAGYKGYLQGTIGGASLYGALGLVIGGLIAAPLLISGSLGFATAAALAAAFGGAGIIKGASTFGTIGSTAAINAESADLSEQRRYLLDRYYDLPEGPEGDREAEAIKQELMREREGRDKPPPFFHWQTALIGAALGAALVLGFMYFSGAALTGVGSAALATTIEGAIESVLHISITHGTATALAGITTSALAATATFGGALLGSTIGIDRYYIRKWFDHTEGVVHGSHHKETALIARSEQIARLKSAAKADEKTKMQIDSTHAARAPNLASAEAITASAPAHNEPVASLSTADNDLVPSTKIAASDATLHRRLMDIQHAMEIPAL